MIQLYISYIYTYEHQYIHNKHVLTPTNYTLYTPTNIFRREELQHFLQGLRISFSKRKWSLIFREIDRDYDNEITFDELLLFVFPNNSQAKEDEKNRDRAVGRLIAKRVGIEFRQDSEAQDRLE